MKHLLAVALVLGVLALRCAGQDNAERFERNVQNLQRDLQNRVDAEVPLANRALVDYGGYLTFGFLSFDDSTHDNHALRQYELVGYGRVNFDGANEVYARGRADYYDYNPGDSFEHQSNRLEGRVEEGWYRFDLQRFEQAYGGRAIPDDVSFKGGRQFVSWGNGLTLDQYADGAIADFRHAPLTLSLLACVTVKETIDFDNSRPDFDHNTHRGFYGARLSAELGKQNPYAYFLLQRDYNRDEPAATHIIPTQYRYNSYYAGAGSNGAIGDHLTYGAEITFEGGRGLSSSFIPGTQDQVTQTYDSIVASAANVRLDYLLNDARKTRFSAQAVAASGDTDRGNTSNTFNGNRPHTIDHAFNGLGVIYDGLAFEPEVSNLLMLRLGASTYPFPHGFFRGLQTGGDFFVFGKTRRDAPIDEPTGNSRYLGCEPDLFVNWQVTDDVSVILRYGVFFPGAAIPSGQQNYDRQFVYAAVTYAF